MTQKYKQFLESTGSEKVYTAKIPYPSMTIQCTFNIDSIKNQMENMPTAQEVADKYIEKYPNSKRYHLDSPLIAWFDSKLLDPASDKPKLQNFEDVQQIESFTDFINVASYISQSELSDELLSTLRTYRDKYVKLAFEANKIISGSVV